MLFSPDFPIDTEYACTLSSKHSVISFWVRYVIIAVSTFPSNYIHREKSNALKLGRY